MSAVPEFKTSAEFEAWLGEHALLAIAYAKENDVAIRDLPVSARVFNTLRLNGVDYVSQLILEIPPCISENSSVGSKRTAQGLSPGASRSAGCICCKT